MNSFILILSEAIVVGVLLLVIVKILESTIGIALPNWVILILAGMIFHIVFEYTGLNRMYVDSYYTKFKVSAD